MSPDLQHVLADFHILTECGQRDAARTPYVEAREGDQHAQHPNRLARHRNSEIPALKRAIEKQKTICD
jgi:hypothetical protein